MQGSNWSTFSNTVNFDILSAKQLIGESIDMAATALQQAIAHYCEKNKTDFPSNPVRLAAYRKTTSRSTSATYWTLRASIDLWSVPAVGFRLCDGGRAVEEAVYQDLDKRAEKYS